MLFRTQHAVHAIPVFALHVRMLTLYGRLPERTQLSQLGAGMDAANPLSRWLLAAGLAAAVGCHSDGKSSLPLARGQYPIAPEAPARAATSPIAGMPLMPTAPPKEPMEVEKDIQKAGYSAVPAVADAAAKSAELLKDSIPQIKVVALVGATNLVTNQEVIEAVRQRYGELHALDGPARKVKEKELYDAELRRVIERELILDEMYAKLKKANRLHVVDEIKEFATKAAEQTIRAMRKQSGNLSEEEFQGILRTQGMTIPVIRRQLERQMMADEYVRSVMREKGRTPGLADIREYYDRHPDQFQSEDSVKWLDIFISFNQHATPRAAYDHAMAVRQKAAAGGDFVALVKQYDNGLAVGTNGVGVGTTRGEIKPQFVEPTVWALEVGAVSQLIETPTGYHIVKIAEREYAGMRPFDSKVQGEIRETLIRQFRLGEYAKLVEELWRNGPVRIIEHP